MMIAYKYKDYDDEDDEYDDDSKLTRYMGYI
jgi:hypothetical protein